MLGRLLRSETRAVSYQQIWGSGSDLVLESTLAGTNISQDTSLKLTAVSACVRLLTDTISTLPADVFYRADGERLPFRPKPAWVDEPDIGLSRMDLMTMAVGSYLLDGNAFIRIFRNAGGEVVSLVVLDPRIVIVERAPDRSIQYRWNNEVVIPASEMLHVQDLARPGHLRAASRVDQMRNVLGIGAALDEFAARFFSNGSVMSGMIEAPAELTNEQATTLADNFRLAHQGLGRSHRVGILSAGAKFTKISVDPEEAQMIQSRQFQVEEIARIFRVPPHMIGVTTPGAMSYASVEQNAIQFVTHTVRPIVARFEAALSRLLPSAAFFRISLDGLLRGDLPSRYQAYSVGIQSGFLTINDIRRFEDFRPVEGGDVTRVPLANVNLAAANVTEMEAQVTMATELVGAGFDPAAALAAVGLPAIPLGGG